MEERLSKDPIQSLQDLRSSLEASAAKLLQREAKVVTVKTQELVSTSQLPFSVETREFFVSGLRRERLRMTHKLLEITGRHGNSCAPMGAVKVVVSCLEPVEGN